jgi:hypothetical protein
MTSKICTAAVIMAGLLLGACQHSGLWGDDEGLRYTQRLDKITDSAGDAKEWNRVVQTDHPYPRYAYDHRIPVDANLTHNAIRCLYKGGERISPQTVSNSTATTSGGTTVAQGASTTQQVSNCKD